MFYEFPKIRTIDDVLPHIEGWDEFIVAERENYTVINYVVAMKETFDMEGPEDVGGSIRRECRGLIFYPDGRIMSRPFHKFFNVGEREETMTENIDMSPTHIIMEKMDGSMIRPVMIGDEMRLGTKMGLTDIAEEAEKWLYTNSPAAVDWVRSYVDRGYTPIFEWIGPENKIVIEYSEHKLVLLAIRHNETGKYYMPEFPVFEMPEVFGSVTDNLDEYVARHRNDEGREGFIIRFANGHHLKGKNDWYVRVHKTKDMIRTDRHVIDLLVREELDDVLPLLDKSDTEHVRELETRFWNAFNDKHVELYDLYDKVRDKTKKEFALEVMPTLDHKEDSKFIFSAMDGKTIRPMLIDHVLSSVSNTTKYERLVVWLGM